MSLTEKTTHAAESRARLLSQFKNRPKMEGIVSAHAAQSQDEETMFFGLLEDRSIETGVGEQLDGIGEIVGEERKGKDDDTYRIYLTARVLVNISSGTAPQINEIADLLITNTMAYSEWYPAAWSIVLADAFTGDPDAIAEILSDARAGGVKGFLEYTLVDDDETFTFSSGDTEEASTDQGWADDVGPVNGDFSAWAGGNPTSWTVTEAVPQLEVSEVGDGDGNGGSGSGACNIYAQAGFGGTSLLSTAVALVVGETYILTFEISYLSVGTLKVDDQALGQYSETYTTTGLKTIEFVAQHTSTRIRFQENVPGPIDATIDDVAIFTTGGDWADAVEA